MERSPGRILEDMRVVRVAGGEPPRRPGARYKASVLRHIERCGVQGQVEMMGFVPEAQLAAALSACDAIVLPYDGRSSKQGLASVSGAAFDALSAGTPVIASDVRAIRDIVTPHGNGLLFPASDVDELTAILRRLRDDASLRAVLRTGARQSRERGSPAATALAALSAYHKR